MCRRRKIETAEYARRQDFGLIGHENVFQCHIAAHCRPHADRIPFARKRHAFRFRGTFRYSVRSIHGASPIRIAGVAK